jgi:hypothetical protein
VTRDLGRHQCPVEGCRVLLPPAKLMCLDHWRIVPESTRKAVYAAYDFGAGIGTEVLAQVQDAAIAAVERKLARKAKERTRT